MESLLHHVEKKIRVLPIIILDAIQFPLKYFMAWVTYAISYCFYPSHLVWEEGLSAKDF